MISYPLLLTTAVLAIAVFTTVQSFTLLIRGHRSHTPANYMLMLWLGIVCVFVVMLFLIGTGFIVRMPWLYRLPSPLYYLAFPAAWLYVRMILKDEVGLKKTDLVHAIPALLHLIEMSPYYFSSYDHKLAMVMADLGSPLGGFRHAEGFLPTFLHNVFRGAQAIGYAIAMGLLTRKFYKNNKSEIIRFEKVLKWIKSITIFQFFLGLTFLVLLGFRNIGTEAFRAFLLYILLAFYCIFWGSYLILHPDILKAMPRLAPIPNFSPHSQGEFDENIETKEPTSTHLPLVDCLSAAPTSFQEVVTSDNELRTDVYLSHQQVLQQFMDRRKPFLEPRYSLSQMAIDLKIPKHHLTYLFNKGMNTSFTEYINQQRIEHIKLKTDCGALEKNTLEALALEAGFNSRITFIRAVQRATGKNPSAYFRATEPIK